MPYGEVKAQLVNSKLVIEAELPDQGEPSLSGRSDNLVDPQVWIDGPDGLCIRLTVCQPYAATMRRARQGWR